MKTATEKEVHWSNGPQVKVKITGTRDDLRESLIPDNIFLLGGVYTAKIYPYGIGKCYDIFGWAVDAKCLTVVS